MLVRLIIVVPSLTGCPGEKDTGWWCGLWCFHLFWYQRRQHILEKCCHWLV